MKTGTKWFIGILSAIGIGTVLSTNKKSINAKMEEIKEKIWDNASEAKILTLHPLVRNKAREFINAAEKKRIKLRVTSAYRSHEEQNDLYAQGRTEPGLKVTNAKGGQSSHNFATAIDVVQIVNGVAKWDADWNAIAVIGKAVGFSWGGDWKSFKDKPHFEMNFGNSLAQLQNKYNSGQKTNGYINLT